MNKKKGLSLIAAILGVCALAIRVGRGGAVGSGEVLVISGNMEVTDVELSFKVAGRLQERVVSEGQPVEAGAVIALLDSTELRQGVEQAEAAVAVAKAEGVRAKLEFARQEELFQKQVVSRREYEVAVAMQGIAEARGREAEAVLAQARTRLDNATLKAPVGGLVLAEHAEAGEYVMPGTPVVTIGDLRRAWMRGYINETDLGRVKVGQAVAVRSDTYPGKVYGGRVSFLASEAEFTPRVVQTHKERVKLVYRIKVEVPNPGLELKPGMPVDAEISLK